MFEFNLNHWIVNAGYVGVVGVIFAETGLFIGFFLPGDSLLFATGLLASQHVFKLEWIVPALVIAAVLGYTLAYYLGEKIGGWLMRRNDSWWFKKKHLHEAHVFYEKHGPKALVLGRLIPVVRTFLPVAAGMAQMPWARYMRWNVWGALIWVLGVTLAGYFLGKRIPQAEEYILPISLLIIVVSVLPAVWHFWKNR